MEIKIGSYNRKATALSFYIDILSKASYRDMFFFHATVLFVAVKQVEMICNKRQCIFFIHLINCLGSISLFFFLTTNGHDDFLFCHMTVSV